MQEQEILSRGYKSGLNFFSITMSALVALRQEKQPPKSKFMEYFLRLIQHSMKHLRRRNAYKYVYQHLDYERPPQDWSDALRHLGYVGNNISQIAFNTNCGEPVTENLLQEIRQMLAELKRKMFEDLQ